MPNFGGNFITEEKIKKLEQLSGEERKEYYSKIVMFIYENLDSVPLFSKA
jgi:hypothetical protein